VKRHRVVLAWLIVLVGTGLYRLLFGPVEEFLARLLPISIWQLPEKAWLSIIATVLASLLAWVSACVVGGSLGMFTAAGELSKREGGWIWKAWAAAANGIRKAFTMLYVIPLVLTISVVTTILLKLELDRRLLQPEVGLLLIVLSGVALAGQRVFIAVDEGVIEANTEDIMLASSLYLGECGRGTGFVTSVRRIWREARFLLACRISLLRQAIEQAFHLAVVGVVILETVSGLRIYEKLFPQESGQPPWGGGIGRVILDAQSAVNPTTVAGAVWLILLIDLVIASLIRQAARRRWVTPYRSQP
jgi:hypothetical protein